MASVIAAMLSIVCLLLPGYANRRSTGALTSRDRSLLPLYGALSIAGYPLAIVAALAAILLGFAR